jgi:hypothetical protein
MFVLQMATPKPEEEFKLLSCAVFAWDEKKPLTLVRSLFMLLLACREYCCRMTFNKKEKRS